MNDDAPHPNLTAEDRLPGDPTKDELVERMIRVDHSGEYGAVRIYAGQRAVLGHSAGAHAIDEMAEKEREHLAEFGRLVGERRVRPTALMPLWHVAGFTLGASYQPMATTSWTSSCLAPATIWAPGSSYWVPSPMRIGKTS